MLADARTGKNGRHRLIGLLRQSVFGRLAGYEDVSDADRLCHDPAMRWVVGDRAITETAASASQMNRFETKWLSRPENLAALANLPGRWIDRVHTRHPPRVACSTWIRARARRMASRKAVTRQSNKFYAPRGGNPSTPLPVAPIAGRAFCYGAQKSDNCARLSRYARTTFPKCEMPHTSRRISERCCLRVGGSERSSDECRIRRSRTS
jgi:hypothetical protein